MDTSEAAFDIPCNTSEAIFDIPCNICSSNDATVVFEAGVAQQHRIVRCKQCSLLYASPRSMLHEREGEVEEIPLEQDRYSQQRLAKEILQVGDYAKTWKLLNSLYPNRGKMLEVGCGYGYLLARFREEGWDVIGIDPYKGGCAYTKATHGIEAIPAILENAGFADETFDVVILNHVIEHMPDPLKSLREINRVLKKGGHFVIETPRYDTLMFKIFGKRERSVSYSGHFYFFTTESLEKMYNLAGFRRTKLWYTGRTLNLERLAWNLGVISKSDTVKKVLDSLSSALHLSKVRIYLNTRDIQRVCVQKV